MAWFETWFDTPYYHILYKDRDFAEAENFISLLTATLQLPDNSKIIDLGCGKGRHSVFLHKMGYNVLGLDLSRESIFHNKQFETPPSLKPEEPFLKFEVHDMREAIYPSVFPNKVDAVFSLFTSFGYFEDQKEDEKVFKSVSDALKENGYFVLDFLNEEWVKNTLVPEYTTEKEGIAFHIKKQVKNRQIFKDIYFTDKGRDFHFFEKVKLHTPEEIAHCAEQFGFERVNMYGDYGLGAFSAQSSPRCINVFVKKG